MSLPFGARCGCSAHAATPSGRAPLPVALTIQTRQPDADRRLNTTREPPGDQRGSTSRAVPAAVWVRRRCCEPSVREITSPVDVAKTIRPGICVPPTVQAPEPIATAAAVQPYTEGSSRKSAQRANPRSLSRLYAPESTARRSCWFPREIDTSGGSCTAENPAASSASRSQIGRPDTLARMSYRLRDRAAQLLAEKSKRRDDVLRALRADAQTGAVSSAGGAG